MLECAAPQVRFAGSEGENQTPGVLCMGREPLPPALPRLPARSPSAPPPALQPRPVMPHVRGGGAIRPAHWAGLAPCGLARFFAFRRSRVLGSPPPSCQGQPGEVGEKLWTSRAPSLSHLLSDRKGQWRWGEAAPKSSLYPPAPRRLGTSRSCWPP